MSEKDVILTVGEDYEAELDSIVERLIEVGLLISRVSPILGIAVSYTHLTLPTIYSV